MGRFALEVGLALRHARRSRGLTLRQVSASTQGRFKPTSVAGYERGERAVSLERFCELCELYSISPGTLLAEIWRSVQGLPELDVDLAHLESLDSAEATLVIGFIQQIRGLRREQPGDTIMLRAGDVEVLATAAGMKPSELVEVLEPGARRDDGNDH